MIEKVFYAVLVTLALFTGIGLMLPQEVHVERSIEIQRPVNTLFTVLNRFEAFPAWSPWTERDPDVEFRFSGPPAGVGARMEWSGDPRQVGTGWMEITASRPNSLVRARLVIDRQGAADTAFEIERIAGGARVTWSFDASLVEGQGWFGGILSRFFGLLFDRWIGGDFERGLDRLRNYAGTLPASDFSGLDVDLVDVTPMDILFVSRAGGSDGDPAGLAAAYRQITSFMAANGLEMAAQPLVLVRAPEHGEPGIDAAIPVHRVDVPGTDAVRWGSTPAGRAAMAVHRGSYVGISPTREKLAAWMAAHGHARGDVSWEQYVSDPEKTPVDQRITRIYILLADTAD